MKKDCEEQIYNCLQFHITKRMNSGIDDVLIEWIEVILKRKSYKIKKQSQVVVE